MAAVWDGASEVESGKSLNVLFAALASMLKPLNQQQTRKSVCFRFAEWTRLAHLFTFKNNDHVVQMRAQDQARRESPTAKINMK